MDLKNALFLCLALFALLQFGFLPRLKNAWSQLVLSQQLKRFGLIAVLEKLRDYCLIAVICFLVFIVFVLVATGFC